jgi:hypothetical protein
MPYPDFKNNEIINPDQFDANSLSISSKLNEVIPRVNAHDKGLITSDTGAPKIWNVNTSDDLLASILAKGIGVHTFYSTFKAVNIPDSARTVRGIAEVTSTGYAWVWAITNNNQFWTNYYEGSWQGWNKYFSSNNPVVWNNLALSGYITSYSVGSTPEYTLKDGVVYIEGAMTNITSIGTTVATLPVGYRPRRSVSFSSPTSGKEHARWTIGVDGRIVLENTTGSGTLTGTEWFPLSVNFIQGG